MTKPHTLVTTLGRNPKTDGGSVNPPVHHTSTLIFDNFQQMRDYEAGKIKHFGYARHGTPTTKALEDALAELEGADDCCVTASGQSATILPLIAFLKSGDHLLAPDSLYSTTRQFIEHELNHFGVEVTFYDPTIGADIAALIQPNTRVVYVESAGSLTFEMQDIPAIAAVAHQHNAVVVADNTWATPLYQKPFDLGIDVSIHAATKYIGGHSDLMMGSVSARGNHAKIIRRTHHRLAMCPAPDNVYLALRGLRTLAVRLKQQSTTALQLATWMEQQPTVARVHYPALPSHPGHALWQRDMTGASALFAFELANVTEDKIHAFVDALQHFGLGYSWGGYESLVTAYQPAKVRTSTHWPDECWLIRLAIGLEDAADLQADVERALARAN